MTEVLVVLVSVVVLLVGALGVTFVPMLRRSSLLDQKRRHRVIVTLKTGASFAGVLTEVDGEAMILAQGEALGVGERGAHVPVDGVVVLLRADVAYLQVP